MQLLHKGRVLRPVEVIMLGGPRPYGYIRMLYIYIYAYQRKNFYIAIQGQQLLRSSLHRSLVYFLQMALQHILCSTISKSHHRSNTTALQETFVPFHGTRFNYQSILILRERSLFFYFFFFSFRAASTPSYPEHVNMNKAIESSLFGTHKMLCFFTILKHSYFGSIQDQVGH